MAPPFGMWEASHMEEQEESALQVFVARLVDVLPQARDHYDRAYQDRTGKSGKPLYDMQRGKSRNPSRDVLRTVADIVGQPVDLFEKAIDGEDVHPLVRKAAGKSDHLDITKAPDLPVVRSASEGETGGIIQIDLNLSMGNGTEIEDFIEQAILQMDIGLVRQFTASPFTKLRLAKGIGDSMEPTLKSGDLVLIDTSQNELKYEDKIWAVRIRGNGAVKRLRSGPKGTTKIMSDNPNVPNDTVKPDELQILGRVVWSIRSH